MDITPEIQREIIAAYHEVAERLESEFRDQRASLERQREDSRQRLKACEINRAAHEANMVQAAQLEHRIDLDRRQMISRIVDTHFPSPLPPEKREEVIRWLEAQDPRN